MGAYLVEKKIIVDDEATITKLHQRGFGKRTNKRLELSLLEGLYLHERGTLDFLEDGKKVGSSEILTRADEDEFLLRYKVYKDLRERGYIVKTGFKFGAHFRVYERGKYPHEHSKYLVHAVPESYIPSFPEISRAVRLAEGVNKTMVFAVVDEEGDITYYAIDRMTP
jgi:tRNA-intron endonuclease